MKKNLVALIVILVIVAAILLGFKACNQAPSSTETSNTTPSTETSSETTTDTTDTTTPPATDDSFRTAFIQASIELSCFLDKNPTVQNDQPELRTQVYNYYKKFNLPVDDDAKMLEILHLYADDTEVIAEIKKGNGECK